MPRPLTLWPEIIFAADGSRAALAKAAREGRIVRIGPGIYSGRPRGREAEIVRHNWARILGHEYPGAIVTDRSARRNGPDHELLTVVHPRRRALELPGLTILPRSGEGPLPGDIPGDPIWFASQPRGLLENLRGGGHRRYLTTTEIESWLADIVATSGARQLNWIRDEARPLAAQAGWERAFKRLDGIIGAVLSTSPIDALETPALRARAAGTPFDHRRFALFEQLAQHLADTPPEPLPLLEVDADRRRLLPFYEAYFSNFIEGTEFTLDEAAAIVFDEQVPANRPQDAHDILGTYRIVADERERARGPRTADELIDILESRHRELMGARPDKRPGRFKDRANRAGATTFVAPELVEETLRRGFDAAVNLLDPFARAVYLGFLVAEVHPFDDGNGRISRMAMNAELSRAAEGRIVIPTVYRNNYLAALRGATHNGAFESLVSALRFAQRYTARIDFSSRRTAEADLVRTNALRDPNEADEVGVRLRLPD
jgi:fido (protein-threonine AMPylation protein)